LRRLRSHHQYWRTLWERRSKAPGGETQRELSSFICPASFPSGKILDMLKAILFDFDGTIVDSLKHHLYAYRQAYNHFGKNLTDEQIIRDAFYTSVDEKTARYQIEDKEKFSQAYFKHLDDAFERLEVQENLIEGLDFLKNKNLKLAIITFAPGERTKMHLKRIGLDKYFDVVLGGDDVKSRKPDPEIAEKAMQLLGVRPAETLLIGDIDLDILTGKNAKTMTALFVPETNLPFADFDLFRKSDPDFEFKNFSELPEKISRFL
jgi:HAD superfamily hydrolase (TIGR01549 family)